MSGALHQIHVVEQTLVSAWVHQLSAEWNIGMLPTAKYQIPLSSTSTEVEHDPLKFRGRGFEALQVLGVIILHLPYSSVSLKQVSREGATFLSFQKDVRTA